MSTNVSALPTPPRTPAASTPLQAYLDLDLTPGSPIAEDLMARAEGEARRASHNLTGDGDAGAVSANLTAGMSGWLGAHVNGKRQTALSEIEAQARRIKGGGGKAGLIAEIEEDRLRRDHSARCTEVRTRFYERHQTRIDSLNNLRREHDEIRAEEGERDAKVPSKLVEFGIPVLVAIPEGFMNYGSFVALTGLGVAGAGLTAVVGGAIGGAAWLAGRFWKAYHFYMRADDEAQQQVGMRMIWIASATLTIALAVVGYARYRTVADKATREILLGLDPSNPLTSTMLLLAGNLLVFFLGALITYMIHDENPRFAEKAAALRKDQRTFDGIRQRELDGKIAEADRGRTQKLADMQKFTRTLASKDEYATACEDLGRLKAKDSEVVGLLHSYRGRLVDLIEPHNPAFTFGSSAADRLSGNATGTIGLSEFTTQPLHLYRGVR